MALLEVHDIELSFGGVKALDGLSLSVPQGGIYSIIGPNGAGKTTLFNVITGAYRPDKGQIFLSGEEITSLPPFKRAEHGVQRTFQNLQIFENMTVLENVMVGNHLEQSSGFISALLGLRRVSKESERARERALSLLELLRLETVRDVRAGELAYGLQKRLELARALAAAPKIVLLDEPAAGLNASETEDLAEAVQSIARMGTTVVLVEHDMSVVMTISDEVLVLNFGRRLAGGTPKEVASNPEVIEAYLGTEVG